MTRNISAPAIAERKLEATTTETQITNSKTQITKEDAQKKAWKYMGYNEYSSFIGYSRSFFFLRQFRTLNVRVLLAMQDDIAELEERLDNLDKELSSKSSPDIHNGTFRDDPNLDRIKLIWKLQKRIQKYSRSTHSLQPVPVFSGVVWLTCKYLDEHIAVYQKVADRDKVIHDDVESVENWLKTYRDAVDEREQKYTKDEDDLIYVIPKVQRPWLHRHFCNLFANKRFRRHPTDKRGLAYDEETLFLQDKERADAFLAKIMLPLGLFMLIGPLWILYIVRGAERRLGVITGFVVLFAALVFFATTARPFETMAATAGLVQALRYALRRSSTDTILRYAAVLLVFMLINTG